MPKPAPLRRMLSAYARQFLDQMERPSRRDRRAFAFDRYRAENHHALAASTLAPSRNLRLPPRDLRHRGVPHCPTAASPSRASPASRSSSPSAREICKPDDRVMILAPSSADERAPFAKTRKIRADGYVRVRINGELTSLMNFQSSTSARTTPSKSSSTACSSSRASRRASSNPSPPRSIGQRLVTVAIVGAKSTLFPKVACPTAESPFRNSSRVPSCSIRLTELARVQRPRLQIRFRSSKIITDWTRPLFDGGLGPGSGSQFSSAHSNSAPTPTASSRNALREIPCAHPEHAFVRLPAVQRSLWRERISREEIKTDKGFRFPGHPEILERNFEESNSELSRVDNAIHVATLWAHARQASAPESLASSSAACPSPISPRLAQRRTPRRRQNSVQLTERQKEIAAVPRRVSERIDSSSPWVSAISLDRSAATLSGGEASASASHANRLASSRRSLRTR